MKDTLKRIGFKVAATASVTTLFAFALLGGSGCAAPQDAEESDSTGVASDEPVSTTSQALSAIGWDRILPPADTDWHLQNATGVCATAPQVTYAVKATTAACDTADSYQDWFRFKKADGREEICRGPEKHVTARQCVKQALSGQTLVCVQWATETYSNRCLQPVRIGADGTPAAYRVADLLLSYKPEIVGTDPATIAYVSTPGTFTVGGDGSIKYGASAVTKGTDGVIVPAVYVGSPAQQWSFVAVPRH